MAEGELSRRVELKSKDRLKNVKTTLHCPHALHKK
jgi:hypothetical protein